MANPKKAFKMLMTCLLKDRPAMLWGKMGEGKSDTVRAAVKALGNCLLIDRRVSAMESVDLSGLPSIIDGRSCYARPEFYPTEEEAAKYDFVAIFFDEVNLNPAMFASLYGLVQDREINGHKLPANCRIVAAGNRPQDHSFVHKFPAALSDRFLHIDFDANNADWQDWARTNGIDERLIDFVEFRPNIFEDVDMSERAFCTRRGLAACNKWIDESEDIRFSLLKGEIGIGAAGELQTYLRIRDNLPPIAKILESPNAFNVPFDKPDLMFALCMALADKVDVKTMANFTAFINRMPKDMTVLAMVTAVKKKPHLKKTVEYINHEIETKDISL